MAEAGSGELFPEFADGAVVVADAEVDEGGSLAGAEIIPAVEFAVDFEGGRFLVASGEGGQVVVLLAGDLFGMDADTGEVVYHVQAVDFFEAHRGHTARVLFFGRQIILRRRSEEYLTIYCIGVGLVFRLWAGHLSIFCIGECVG